MSRPETGPMKFGDDWTGLFIRGDEAFNYAAHLREALKVLGGMNPRAPFVVPTLLGLLGLLETTNEATTREAPQRLKPWPECANG